MTDNRTWRGRTRGGSFGMRSVAWMARHIGVSPIYLMMSLSIPFYMLSDRKACRALYYFYRFHLGCGKIKSVAYVAGCFFEFGKVVVDKFAFYGGAKGKYALEGGRDWPATEIFSSSGPSLIISGHIGNLEAVGVLLEQEAKDMYCLVYAGERREVLDRRAEALKSCGVNLIPVGDGMEYMFEISSAISRGGVIILTADRMLGEGRGVECDFLGGKVMIPAGAFAIAARMKVPLYTAFVMRTGHCRYRVFLEKIDAQSASDRNELVRKYAGEFCSRMEKYVRKYPLQWFNFYDYWNEIS